MINKKNDAKFLLQKSKRQLLLKKKLIPLSWKYWD